MQLRDIAANSIVSLETVIPAKAGIHVFVVRNELGSPPARG
jgi:hypothetical protein